MTRILVFVACAIVVGACAATSTPMRFYTLESTAAEAPGARIAPATGPDLLLIAPVLFPAYLDRPQFVVRPGGGHLEMLEFDRWAEPLEAGFVRVLTENLAARLGPSRVFQAPYVERGGSRNRLMARVTRFDVDGAGLAHLEVQWQLRGNGESAPPVRSAYQREASGTDVAARVLALSAIVDDFAADVARSFAERAQDTASRSR